MKKLIFLFVVLAVSISSQIRHTESNVVSMEITRKAAEMTMRAKFPNAGLRLLDSFSFYDISGERSADIYVFTKNPNWLGKKDLLLTERYNYREAMYRFRDSLHQSEQNFEGEVLASKQDEYERKIDYYSRASSGYDDFFTVYTSATSNKMPVYEYRQGLPENYNLYDLEILFEKRNSELPNTLKFYYGGPMQLFVEAVPNEVIINIYDDKIETQLSKISDYSFNKMGLVESDTANRNAIWERLSATTLEQIENGALDNTLASYVVPAVPYFRQGDWNGQGYTSYSLFPASGTCDVMSAASVLYSHLPNPGSSNNYWNILPYAKKTGSNYQSATAGLLSPAGVAEYIDHPSPYGVTKVNYGPQWGLYWLATDLDYNFINGGTLVSMYTYSGKLEDFTNTRMKLNFDVDLKVSYLGQYPHTYAEIVAEIQNHRPMQLIVTKYSWEDSYNTWSIVGGHGVALVAYDDYHATAQQNAIGVYTNGFSDYHIIYWNYANLRSAHPWDNFFPFTVAITPGGNSGTLINPPSTASPSNNQNVPVGNVTLSWANVGASEYSVQISQNSSFSNYTYNYKVTSNNALTTEFDETMTGKYYWRVSAKNSSGNWCPFNETPFTFTVVAPDNTAPTVTITAPTNGATVDGTVSFSANATDNQSGMNRVEFFVGVNKIATATTSPFTTLWNTSSNSNGTYQLKAVAYDNAGNSNQHTISVIVNNAPPAFANDYSITNISANKPNPIVGEQVTFTATLKNAGLNSQSSGQSVKFYINGNLISQTTSTPALAPGATKDLTFLWTAQQGSFNAKAQCFLSNDQNPSNDFKETAISGGVAGNLLVNGSTAPTSNFTLNPNSNSSFSAVLLNNGSAGISGSVSKTGNNSSWVNLTDGTTFNLNSNESKSYSFSIAVPNGTTPGDYSASIGFTYNNGSNAVNLSLQIKVVNFGNGLFEAVLLSGNTLIDGTNQSFTSANFPPGNSFDLDNYSSTTSINTKEEFTHTLNEDQYKRMNNSVWYLQATEEQGSASLRLSISPSDKYKSYTSSVSGITLDIMEWWSVGTNTVKISLDNFVHNQNNVKWAIYNTYVNIDLSKNAWATSYSISQSTLDLWSAGWNKGQILFDVPTLNKSGDVHLYVNGKKVRTIAVSSSGTNKSFTLSKTTLSTNNYINIKGDSDDGTKMTISNVRLKVEYFSGDPNLSCTKSIASNSFNIGENITVNLSFQNNGSNIAKSVTYNDNPLPEGLSLVSGNLSSGMGSIDPGQSKPGEYVIKSNNVGQYSFGSTVVTYENPSGAQFSTSFNGINFIANGGNLLINPTVNSNQIIYLEPLRISATVTGSILNNPVTDAVVQCTIRRPDMVSNTFYLVYNPATLKYEGQYLQTDILGNYTAEITASRDYYTTGILQTPIAFSVFQNLPAPYNLGAVRKYNKVLLTWSYSAPSVESMPQKKGKTLVEGSLSSQGKNLNIESDQPEGTFTSFLIYRSNSAGGPYTLIGTSLTQSYTDQSVISGNHYYYAVSAMYSNPSGESAKSNEAGIQFTIVPVITISDTSPIMFGNVHIGASSLSRSYSVSATELTSELVLAVSSSFKISFDSLGSFLDTLKLIPNDTGWVVNKKIFVKFTPTQSVAYTGIVRHTSSGALPKSKEMYGSGFNPLQVTSPLGGENWQTGTQQNITWNIVTVGAKPVNSNGTSRTDSEQSVTTDGEVYQENPLTGNAVLSVGENVTNIKIEYSTNGGTNWSNVVPSTPASGGSYLWTIPNTPSAQCKIRLTDTQNPLVYDTSRVFQISASQQAITVNAKIVLHGPYSSATGVMNNSGILDSIPKIQPYSVAPWNYTGNETVTAVPAQVMDWVLLELRTGTTAATMVARKAAFIKTDGQIVGLDGTQLPSFTGVQPGNYYLVIRHRNHLGIMTASSIALSASSPLYDFTTGLSKAYGLNPLIDCGNGVYGMISGDGDGSGGVVSTDRVIWRTSNASVGYLRGDYDLSGRVAAPDLAKWQRNNGKYSQIPN